MQKLMSKKGETEMGALIWIFIAVIVCLSLFTAIINTQNLVTEKQIIVNESQSLSACYATSTHFQVNESATVCNITIANVPSGWRAADGESQCYIGNVVVTNEAGNLTLVLATDYNVFAQTGIIQFLNTSDTNATGIPTNITFIDYNFCDEGYNKDSSSRGIARLWGLFAALIIISAAVYGTREWITK